MKVINIAIIGCSSIAERMVLPAIKENKLFNLVMVGSRTEGKGKQFAEKFNCRYGSYNDVLSTDDVDAIYVSVPSGLHYEWGKKVIEAKKHLLLEKPFTDTLEHSKEIIDIADEFKLIAMEGLAYIFHPWFQELKKLLADNIIGDVRLLESSFGFPLLPITDVRNDFSIGGGAILDNLIYPLSISLNIFGSKYVKKDCTIHYNKDLNIDERGFLRIDWENSAAHLSYGFGFSYKNTLEIWGTKGSIFIDRVFTKPKTMITEIMVKKNNEVLIYSVLPADQFSLMLHAFYNKIFGFDKSCINEKLDILSRMEIISEMYRKKF